MVILFTTYPLDIQRAIVNISIRLDLPQTHLQISQCLCYLKSRTPTLSYFRSSYFGAPPKIPTFLDTSNSQSLLKPFELNSNDFEFNSCNLATPIFRGPCTFLRVQENYPRARTLSLTFLFFPFSFSLFFFQFEKSKRERRSPTASRPPGLFPLPT